MTMMAPPLPTLWLRLPVGGWQVGFWIDGSGRMFTDVADSLDTLVCRLAGARQAAASVTAGWTGWGSGPDRLTRSWALAIGRTPAGRTPALSFVSAAGESPVGQDEGALLPDGWTGLRVTGDGLWIATAVGCAAHIRLAAYSHVRLNAPHVTLQHPLVQVGASPAR
jgi:hypothetical protein